MQFVFRRLRLYTARYGDLAKGKMFRTYLFGHEFLAIGDVTLMKKMMMQVRERRGGAAYQYAGTEDLMHEDAQG